MIIKKIVWLSLSMLCVTSAKASLPASALIQAASVLIKIGDHVEVARGIHKGQKAVVCSYTASYCHKPSEWVSNTFKADGTSNCSNHQSITKQQRKELKEDAKATRLSTNKQGGVCIYDLCFGIRARGFDGFFHSTRLKKLAHKDPALTAWENELNPEVVAAKARAAIEETRSGDREEEDEA